MADVPQDRTSTPSVQRRGVLVRAVGAALCTALIGSAALAFFETAATALYVSPKMHGESPPFDLVVAQLGKTAVSHTFLWCPVMAVCGLVVWVFRRHASNPPEALLWGLFVLLSGLVIVPEDLGLAGRDSTKYLVAGAVGCVFMAAAVCGLVAFVRWLLGPRGFARIRNVLAAFAVLFTLGFGTAMARSLLYSAATYRVPAAAATQARPERCHVLWVVLDTVRSDYLGCYDPKQKTTPFLDAWAANSLVFESGVANGIWTLPSHASMFTGLSHRHHGTHADYPWLDQDLKTLAEILAENDYETACFSNNPLIAWHTNLARGFQYFRAMEPVRHLTRFSLEHLCERWGLAPPAPWFDGDNGAAATNHLIARWLDERPDVGQPFFAFVNYMECHLPYRVPAEYRRMFMTEPQLRRSYKLREQAFGDIASTLNIRFNIEGGDFFPDADREVMRLQYAAAVRYLDDRVRELLDIFARRGLLDHTLVVITSDHGEYLGGHGLWSHVFQTYNDLALVPLLIREPGRTQGRRVAAPAQLSDLFQTTLNATLGTNEPGPEFGSRDLLVLADGAETQRVAITEYHGPGRPILKQIDRCGNERSRRLALPQVAAIDQRFKYIASEDGRRELYDLAADPLESTNVADEYPAELQRLAGFISQWRLKVPIHKPTRPSDGSSTPQEALDALRGLGYIGGN